MTYEDFIKIDSKDGVIGRICWTNKDFVPGQWGGLSLTWSWGAKRPLPHHARRNLK